MRLPANHRPTLLSQRFPSDQRMTTLRDKRRTRSQSPETVIVGAVKVCPRGRCLAPVDPHLTLKVALLLRASTPSPPKRMAEKHARLLNEVTRPLDPTGGREPRRTWLSLTLKFLELLPRPPQQTLHNPPPASHQRSYKSPRPRCSDVRTRRKGSESQPVKRRTARKRACRARATPSRRQAPRK